MRSLRSRVRRQFFALAAMILYFLLVMGLSSGSAGSESQASVLWTLLGAGFAYGLGYALFPLVRRVYGNLSGEPVRKHRSRD